MVSWVVEDKVVVGEEIFECLLPPGFAGGGKEWIWDEQGRFVVLLTGPLAVASVEVGGGTGLWSVKIGGKNDLLELYWESGV